LTCGIEGLSPTQAMKGLLDGGLQLVEAQPAGGGLEELYLKHITGDVR
jgi:hypothetical protein